MKILRVALYDQNEEVRRAAKRVLRTKEGRFFTIDDLTSGLAPAAKLKLMKDFSDNTWDLPRFQLRTIALALKDNKENKVWAAEKLAKEPHHRDSGFFTLILSVFLNDPTADENAQLLKFGAKAAVCAFADYEVPESKRNEQINSLLRNVERSWGEQGRVKILELLSGAVQEIRRSPGKIPCSLLPVLNSAKFGLELEKLVAQLNGLKKPGSMLPEPESQPCSVPDAKDALAPLEGKGQKCERKGNGN